MTKLWLPISLTPSSPSQPPGVEFMAPHGGIMCFAKALVSSFTVRGKAGTGIREPAQESGSG